MEGSAGQGYKRYLIDPRVPVPLTTAWRRKRQTMKTCRRKKRRSHHERESSESDTEQSHSLSSVLTNCADDELASDPNDKCSFATDNRERLHDRGSELPHISADDETTPADIIACSYFDNEEQLRDVNAVQVDYVLADSEQNSPRMLQQLYDESDISDSDHDNETVSTSTSVTHCVERDLCTISCNQQLESSGMSPADLMLLLVKLKHNLTKDATEDIAKLLNVVSDKTVASSSMHNLLKKFCTGKQNVEVHHFCKNCGSYVGIVVSGDICCPLSRCSGRISLQDNLEGGYFFFYLPLASQLIDLFENHNISYHLKHYVAKDDNLCDIMNGGMFRKLSASFRRSGADCHLTLTFNCDGVPVFKSSSFAIWPILCAVNELPPNIRGDHILLASLWFGSWKPDMNTFLQPFTMDCISLAAEGFSCYIPENNVRLTCKATVVVGVCDAVARPLMQNFKQYNGHYGCSFCLNAGETVEKGKGHTRVYLLNEETVPRTSENTHAFASEATETETSCMGVKGPSMLSRLPHFDIIHGMVPDYMHCICLGIVRQIANLWFDTKNHDKAFYIGAQVPNINCRLLAIKPPCSISRTPRSIALLKFWKAHEWLAWLLYYSLPVLRNILPVVYYTHWGLLVECTGILLGNNISLAQLVYCERAFLLFVSDFRTLYGKEHMSYNVHQLLHITQSVRDWGPLWSHSAFMFEACNAVLLNMVKGTQGVPVQILNVFSLTRAIPYNVRAVLPNCSQPEAMFIRSLTTHRRTIKTAVNMSNGVTVLGRAVLRPLKRSHIVALHSVTDTVTQTCAAYYSRAVHRGEILHCYEYCRDLKRNSYTVQIVDGTYYQITTFLVTDVGYGETCYALGRYLRQVPFHFNIHTSPQHIVPVAKIPSALVAIPVSDIIRKCVFVSLSSCEVNFVCNQVHINDMCV